MSQEKEARKPRGGSAEWPFPTAAALGSSVRAKGIEQEIRARLPWAGRKLLSVENGTVVLRMALGSAELAAAAAAVSAVLERIDALPVLPREVEDILSITAHERQKWTKAGRLKSAGTRTVKLRGRSKAVTFHVFDPRHIEDVLDRDLATVWREEDAQAAAETRRRAAGKAALTRSGKRHGPAAAAATAGPHPEREKGPQPRLAGWDTFEAEGLLR